MYVMLEDIYKKNVSEELPMGWYSIDAQKRIDILKDAIKNKIDVVETPGYYDVMEKVIPRDGEMNKR